MSQVMGPNDPFDTYQRPSGTNVLGIVGFILAFCISPVGLIVSLLGLMKAPRGFAIAGVIIGLLGTGVWACGGFAYSKFGPEFQRTIEMTKDFEEIQKVATPTSTDISALGLSSDLTTDPWGSAYRIGPNADASSFQLTSDGPDKLPGTPDDYSIDGKLKPEEAASALMEEMFSRAGYQTNRTTTRTTTRSPTPAPPQSPENPPAKDNPPAPDQSPGN